jgi:hypothetical protein
VIVQCGSNSGEVLQPIAKTKIFGVDSTDMSIRSYARLIIQGNPRKAVRDTPFT